MDETTTGSESSPPPRSFNWHIDRTELLAMTEEDRAVYLNEKTSRVYDALSVIAQADGATIRREDIEVILNPEELEDRHKGFEDLGER